MYDTQPPPGKGKGKQKAVERASPAHISSDSHHDDNDDSNDSNDLSYAEGSTRPSPSPPPSKSSKPKPMPPPTTGDGRDEARLKAWEELFTVINEPLHLASLLVECLNPHLTLQLYKLGESLKRDKRKHGELLSLNKCYLPGVAVHFNMAPKPGDFHLDGMSLFLGWESVSSHCLMHAQSTDV